MNESEKLRIAGIIKKIDPSHQSCVGDCESANLISELLDEKEREIEELVKAGKRVLDEASASSEASAIENLAEVLTKHSSTEKTK